MDRTYLEKVIVAFWGTEYIVHIRVEAEKAVGGFVGVERHGGLWLELR